MNALVISFGGAGNIHPLAAVAEALLRRGHRVCFVSYSKFEPLARKLGLEFAGYASAGRPGSDRRGARSASSDRRIVHAVTDVSWVALGFSRWLTRKRVIVEPLRWVYRLIEQRYVTGDTVVVVNTNVFAARIAQERLHVPVATVHLHPAVLRSVHSAPGLPLPEGDNVVLQGLRGLLWACIDLCAEPIVMPEVNAFRAELGLPPLHRPFAEWVHSPELVIGLFPEWFGPRQADWPSRTYPVGFPLFDEGGVRAVPPEIESFLADGPPPIIFSVGSHARRSRPFFLASAEACTTMGWRGVFLAPTRDLVPEKLPKTLCYSDYTPLSSLLAGAAAIVHHGGIGTTGLALAAGVPQLIVPFADDHSDNAARVQQLRAGLAVNRSDYNAKRAARELVHLLTSGEIAANCRSAAERIRQQPTLSEACSLIERLASRSSSAESGERCGNAADGGMLTRKSAERAEGGVDALRQKEVTCVSGGLGYVPSGSNS